ncbi:MAG: hypothetical protein AB1810_10685 [Pseudomonadota bacterium]
MGSILVNAPDLSDNDLIYDEAETRQILKFFWPNDAAAIDAMTINNDTRRLAQTALIAAIEGTYAVGYIQKLFTGVARPSKGIGDLAKRLARNFTRQWWQHAQPRDLEDVRIYDFIRDQVAGNLKGRLKAIQNGAALQRGPYSFHAYAQPANKILWS